MKSYRQNASDEVELKQGSLKQTFAVIVVLLLIPALGFLTALFVFTDINTSLLQQGLLPANDICDRFRLYDVLGEPVTADSQQWCSQVSRIVMLADVSMLAAIIGLLIPITYWFAVRYAGHDRTKIARIFPALTRGSIWLITVLVFLHGGILTYVIYIGESYLFETVHLFLVGVIGLGSLIAGIALIANAATLTGKLRMTAFGKRITAEEAPELFHLIDDIVKKLGSRSPNNIIVGIEPTFYVTSSKIILPDEKEPLVGETLYISTPLAKLMSRAELSAVLGHEFGHFRGDDTFYSMKFAPVYAGLGSSLRTLVASAEAGLLMQLSRIPAIILLLYLWNQFSLSTAAISRSRELEADKAGAEVSSSQALAHSLIKISLAIECWPEAIAALIRYKQKGSEIPEFGTIFKNTVNAAVRLADPDTILATVMDNEMVHPTDSHPSLRTRLNALSIPADVIPPDLFEFQAESSADLIPDCDAIEQELTKLIVNFEVLPDDKAFSHKGQFLELCYRLAAMIFNLSDHFDPQALRTVEGSGERLFENFDISEFRKWINRQEDWSDVVDFIVVVGKELGAEDKERLMTYLGIVANSDNHRLKEKNDMIHAISAILEPERIIEIDI